MSTERTPEALAAAMRSIEAAFLVGVPDATEVWLVRHGDCYEGMADGEDPPLSPLGRAQARRLAERVSRIRCDAVWSSPLRRALETARAIRPDVHVDERLVELGTDLSDGRVEFTEPPDGVQTRMRSVVDDVVAAHPGGRVIVVSHAGAILGYLCDVLRVQYGTLRLLPYYTSVNVVRVLGDRRMAGSLADVAHLEV
jgi:probable phosphoglycerate mutase